jgi:hypothetical protein
MSGASCSHYCYRGNSHSIDERPRRAVHVHFAIHVHLSRGLEITEKSHHHVGTNLRNTVVSLHAGGYM